jgi:O-antigen/teichoic acid export membrane protein
VRSSNSLKGDFQIFTHRLGLNSFWLVVSRLGSQTLSALTIILVARALGPSGLGGFTLITTLILVANVFTTFGLDTLLVRELARSRDPHSTYLSAALWLQLALSIVMIIGLLLMSGRIPNQTPATHLAIQIYSLALLPLAYYTVYSAVLRAYERMGLFLLVNFLVTSSQLVGAWLVLRLGGDLVSLSIILLTSQTLGALAARWLSNRVAPGIRLSGRPPQDTRRLVRQVLHQSWLLALLGGLAVISQRLGVLALSFIAGQSMTGTFSAATRLVELLKLGHYAYFGALFPVLSAQAGKNSPKQEVLQPISRRLVRLSFASLMLLSIGAALVLHWSAGPLISLLYGPGYAPSAELLKLLVWILVPYTISAQLSLEMVTKRQERYVVSSSVVSISLAALAYLALVPRLGLNGAGLAAISAEAANALALMFFSLRMHWGNIVFLPSGKSRTNHEEIRHEIPIP